jgi:hypothetical protein
MKINNLKTIIKHILSEMYNMKDAELDTYGPVNVGEQSSYLKGREYFSKVPVGTYFTIAGMPNTFKKENDKSAIDFGFGGSTKTSKVISISRDIIVTPMPLEKIGRDINEDNVNEMRNLRDLSIQEKQQMRIAVKTLRMPDEMVSAMGGMSKEKAKNFLQQVIGVSDEEIERIILAAGTSVDEESDSGDAGAFSSPFAFKKTKKKKRVKEESNFVNKIRERIYNKRRKVANEKTNPDGTYTDDMLNGKRDNRFSSLEEDNKKLAQDLLKKAEERLKKLKLKGWKKEDFVKSLDKMWKREKPIEEETSSGAVGQAGGMISTPAWGTKNKEGSPRAIAASKSLGYKPVKSISEKEKKINEGKSCRSCKGRGKLTLRHRGDKSEIIKCPYCGSKKYNDQDIKNLQTKLGITSPAIIRKKKI